MTIDHIPDIPFDMLDDFLFNEVIGQLHPTLEHILRDVEYMQHRAEGESIASIRWWWPVEIPYYICTPWFLHDVLPVTDAQMIALGKAHLLYFADSILSDNIVDLQLGDIPGTFLVTSQLRVEGIHYWLSQFASDHHFWSMYRDTERSFYRALAYELHIVEHQRMSYTVEDYLTITHGKFAIYERMLHAMSYLSSQSADVAVMLDAFRAVFVADCLFDDAADWQADAQAKRRTLPIVLALEATKTPLNRFPELSIPELEALINQSNVIPRITAKALEYLEEARANLHAADLGTTYLASLVERRRQNALESHHIYRVSLGLDNFISALGNKA